MTSKTGMSLFAAYIKSCYPDRKITKMMYRGFIVETAPFQDEKVLFSFNGTIRCARSCEFTPVQVVVS